MNDPATANIGALSQNAANSALKRGLRAVYLLNVNPPQTSECDVSKIGLWTRHLLLPGAG